MTPARLIPILLTLAWLAPLAGAIASWIAGRVILDRRSRAPAWIAIAAMAVSLNLALIAGGFWWRYHVRASGSTSFGFIPKYDELSGSWYNLGNFGSLSLSLDYYIDSLTILLFAVVTLIATAVHVYSVAYIGEGHPDDDVDDSPEPTPAELDPDAALHDAQPSPFNPQLARFFPLLQFFTFTMLGLVLAGNLLQVFVFWELVGALSYLLIGFHFERPHAAAAATKAFVMNRIGDAGFLVGIAILWTAFGTLSLGRHTDYSAGILLPRELGGAEIFPDVPGLIDLPALINTSEDDWSVLGVQPVTSHPRWWLILAGLCLFAGCIGKSAQLPLSTWLPDAMAGPTPVSALVHSATMVAAGVYLIARLDPLFLPEVLLVIAYGGAITLVYGATCALVQTDLKRILAWSTVSQLGFMMLALGVGGREEGLFHLVTHAFFKGLLFLAAGSVIVAAHHVQDLGRLGGLWKRMPITAATSLVGVIAITGLAIPLIEPFGEPLAFSGYHSKDSILAAALTFARSHPQHGLLFAFPLITAGLTAFYMFRFWLLAFAGPPRDEELHRDMRESSPLMTAPLVVLALFAAFIAIGGQHGPLFETIAASRSAGPLNSQLSTLNSNDAHDAAAVWGLLASLVGTAAALTAYGAGLLDTSRAHARWAPLLRFFRDGWKLDSLYRVLVVRAVTFLAFAASLVDRFLFDKLALGLGRSTLALSRLERTIDERLVDGLVDRLAAITYETGRGLRHVQSGHLRQYVMVLAAAAVILFMLTIVLIPKG